MFKNVYNFVVQNRFIQLVAENETLKRLYPRERNTFGGKYLNRKKLPSVFERCLFRPVFKNIENTSFKKPAVLLGGILSFFGYEKLPEEPELIMKMKWGILYTQRQEYEKAEKMFHDALKLAQDENDEDGVTYAYDMLANLALDRGDLVNAEKLFVSVLQRLLAKGEPQDSNKVIHISLKLAKMFEDKKEFQKADQGFQFCLETLDKKMEGVENVDEDVLALWGMSMDWYGRFLLGIGKKNEALNCFKKAYEMCVKINGEEHEQSAILLNDLGTISSLMGDTETAMNYLEKARDIGSKLPEMKDLAAIYINLGQLYLLREMYAESKSACEKGLTKAMSYKDDVATSEAKECLKSIKEIFKEQNKAKEYKLINTKGLKNAQLVN